MPHSNLAVRKHLKNHTANWKKGILHICWMSLVQFIATCLSRRKSTVDIKGKLCWPWNLFHWLCTNWIKTENDTKTAHFDWKAINREHLFFCFHQNYLKKKSIPDNDLFLTNASQQGKFYKSSCSLWYTRKKYFLWLLQLFAEMGLWKWI